MESDAVWEVPQSLAALPGKLVYVSMGSMGCAGT